MHVANSTRRFGLLLASWYYNEHRSKPEAEGLNGLCVENAMLSQSQRMRSDSVENAGGFELACCWFSMNE